MLGLRMLACSTGAVIYLTNADSVNLYSAYVGQYGVPAAAVAIHFIIPAGVMIGSTSATIPALLNPANWPVGSVINLVNQGLIAGMGGAGGIGGIHDYFSSVVNPTAGKAGGTALKAEFPIAVDNSAGIIQGGGGGGGGAGARQRYSESSYGGSGGGGAGAQPGPPGLKYGSYESVRGKVGTLTAGGAGGVGLSVEFGVIRYDDAGDGGAGGAPGTAGATGESVAAIPSVSSGQAGAVGGAAGKAVEGSGHVTWVSTGTTLGPIA